MNAADLRRIPLTVQQKALLRAKNWPKFGLATVIAIAEAWEGGHGCDEIAMALGLRFRAVCMTLGPVRQCGVVLRPPKETRSIPSPALTEATVAARIEFLERQVSMLSEQLLALGAKPASDPDPPAPRIGAPAPAPRFRIPASERAANTIRPQLDRLWAKYERLTVTLIAAETGLSYNDAHFGVTCLNRLGEVKTAKLAGTRGTLVLRPGQARSAPDLTPRQQAVLDVLKLIFAEQGTLDYAGMQTEVAKRAGLHYADVSTAISALAAKGPLEIVVPGSVHQRSVYRLSGTTQQPRPAAPTPITSPPTAIPAAAPIPAAARPSPPPPQQRKIAPMVEAPRRRSVAPILPDRPSSRGQSVAPPSRQSPRADKDEAWSMAFERTPKQRASPPPPNPSPAAEPDPVDQDSWLTAVDLDPAPVSRGCRWPTNSWPAGEGWRVTFCGKPKTDVGFYCEHHHAKSMTTAAKAAEDRKRAAIARAAKSNVLPGRFGARLRYGL